jgi:hypothetical protein
MINEANEPSSACRLWRIFMVETSTPPATAGNMGDPCRMVKRRQQETDPDLSVVSGLCSESVDQTLDATGT